MRLVMVALFVLLLTGCSAVRDVYYSEPFQQVVEMGVREGVEVLVEEQVRPIGPEIVRFLEEDLEVEITDELRAIIDEKWDEAVAGIKEKGVKAVKDSLNSAVDWLTDDTED